LVGFAILTSDFCLPSSGNACRWTRRG